MSSGNERSNHQRGTVHTGTGIGLTRADGQRLENLQQIEGLKIQDIRKRVKQELASEILMDKYGEEGLKAAEEELRYVGPRALQMLVVVMTKAPHLTIRDILKAIKEKNARLLEEKEEKKEGRQENVSEA